MEDIAELIIFIIILLASGLSSLITKMKKASHESKQNDLDKRLEEAVRQAELQRKSSSAPPLPPILIKIPAGEGQTPPPPLAQSPAPPPPPVTPRSPMPPPTPGRVGPPPVPQTRPTQPANVQVAYRVSTQERTPPKAADFQPPRPAPVVRASIEPPPPPPVPSRAPEPFFSAKTGQLPVQREAVKAAKRAEAGSAAQIAGLAASSVGPSGTVGGGIRHDIMDIFGDSRRLRSVIIAAEILGPPGGIRRFRTTVGRPM